MSTSDSFRPGFPSGEMFSPEIVHRLFDAVNIDDVVDEHVELPTGHTLPVSDDDIHRCYALCLQFWNKGFTREELQGLVNKLLREGDLAPDERLRFKYIRAKYKHLRFAQRLYSRRHKASFLFVTTTVQLGQLQDAYRNGHRSDIAHHGRKVRMLLSKPVWSYIQHTMINTTLDSAKRVQQYSQRRLHMLSEAVKKPVLSGEEFHSMRKIVSQQVSFYDTLRSIDTQQEDIFKMSRFLAAINGLMGDRHDEMVADALSGKQNYDTPIKLDDDIRWRIEKLVQYWGV